MGEVTWTTLEFEPQDRHPDWNWYVGLISAIIAAITFFYGDIFFGIFIVVAGITVIIYAIRPPKHLTIRIIEQGVVINDDITPYASITQFWLDETDKPDKLLLLVKGSFVPLLSLPLEGVTAETVRAALKPHTTEAFLRESRSIKIFEHLGF
jgi:hypothetical protein